MEMRVKMGTSRVPGPAITEGVAAVDWVVLHPLKRGHLTALAMVKTRGNCPR